MKKWKIRLYEERVELMRKYEKLSHFLDTAKLEYEHLKLLREQKEVMYDYLTILDKRIDLS